MAFSWATVSFSYEDADGSGSTGEVEFELSQPITNAGVTMGYAPVVVTLQNGFGSAILASTEDANTQPSAFWNVTERIDDRDPVTWSTPMGSGYVSLATLRPQVDWG
jgi:hypothetical protein